MKKYIIISLIALATGATSLLAEPTGGTNFWIFDDNNVDGSGTDTSGDYAPGAFITFDITASYNGMPPADLSGVTLYLESLLGGSAAGGIFTVTGMSHVGSLFDDPNGTAPGVMNEGVGANDSNDIGASMDFDMDTGLPAPLGFGDHFVGTVTLQITGVVTNGQTYTIASIFGPSGDPQFAHGSVFSDRAGNTVDIAAATYTVNIVPEPATWSLIGLGGLGALGISCLRARRRG